MEETTKMILVPPEIFSRLDTKQLTDMDKEMHGILYNTQCPDELKWKMYSQTLHKYLHVVKEKDKTIEIPLISKKPQPDATPATVVNEPQVEIPTLLPTKDAQVIHLLKKALPKTLKEKGIDLLNILMSGPHVSWKETGEINVNGKDIKNSNIVDLVCNAVRSKSNAKPTGWHEFSKAVIDSNVPKQFLGKNIEAAYFNNTASEHLTPEPSTSRTPVLASAQNRKKVHFSPYVKTWSKFKI